MDGEETSVPATSPGAPQTGSLWMLFATGLCSMAMEVIWIRQFTVYLGNVVYAFAVILAIYLSATFLGSSAYRKWIRSSAATVFSAVWIPLGLTALLPLLFADPRLPLPEAGESAVLGLAWGAVRAALGIGFFSGAIGFLTPMLVDRRSGAIPRAPARPTRINVLGCILGPLSRRLFHSSLGRRALGIVPACASTIRHRFLQRQIVSRGFRWNDSRGAVAGVSDQRFRIQVSAARRNARSHRHRHCHRRRHEQAPARERRGHDEAHAHHENDGSPAFEFSAKAGEERV